MNITAESIAEAFKDARQADLFEDGVSADLHGLGIHTTAEAYMRGRTDAFDEIESTARYYDKRHAPRRDEALAFARRLRDSAQLKSVLPEWATKEFETAAALLESQYQHPKET